MTGVAARTLLILVIMTLALAGMIARKQYTLNTGTLVLLETQPVDPRSLFRGDYVRLNFSINSLSPLTLEGDDAFSRGDSVYVVLEQGARYWEAVSVHRRRPDTGPGKPVIKGRVRDGTVPGIDRLTVDYGIENYFVPEGQGLELERVPVTGRLDLRIAIDRFGNAGIKEVLVNGRVRYREKLL